MNRRIAAATTALAASALILSACSGSSDPDSSSSEGGSGESSGSSGGVITLSGWSLSQTPEFQVLADAWNATDPDYTVEVVEYDAGDYDTLMIADLAAGTAPDIITQKNQANFYTYADGGQLMDVSDIAATIEDNPSTASFEVEGATYAIPYRQDQWVLFYNKDLFAAAGVDEPDGTWTWDDYEQAATDLTEGLSDQGIYGTYLHGWNTSVQGFANGQVDGGDPLSGDFEYYRPYYERALRMQDAGLQQTFGNITTNELHYTSEFGTQKAAMTLMGSWYVASLIAQQASGDADEFAWGIAPAPQLDDSTVYPDGTPRTIGNPTGLAINTAIDEAKVDAAMEFLTYAGSADAANAVAGIGITPAVVTDEVATTFFATDGAPQDELSQWTFSNRDITPEHPTSPLTQPMWTVLGDFHSAVMSESESLDAGLAAAEQRAQDEVLN